MVFAKENQNKTEIHILKARKWLLYDAGSRGWRANLSTAASPPRRGAEVHLGPLQQAKGAPGCSGGTFPFTVVQQIVSPLDVVVGCFLCLPLSKPAVSSPREARQPWASAGLSLGLLCPLPAVARCWCSQAAGWPRSCRSRPDVTWSESLVPISSALATFFAKQAYIEYRSPNPIWRLDLAFLNRSRRKINCYPEESYEGKYQTDSFFAFKFCWSEKRGWILDQTSVAVLQSNTHSLWRWKLQLLQLALMNQQLFVGATRAIRLPARRVVFVMLLHPSDLGYFTQADLTDPQLKWRFHLILRGWEKAFEDFICSYDELGRGMKSNKGLLLQQLGHGWDSWLLHYSKHVGGLSHVLRSKRGAVTVPTPLRGKEPSLCRSRVTSAVPYAARVDREPFPLSCFEVTGSIFLAGSQPSGGITLSSGNLKSVFNFFAPVQLWVL